MTDIQSWDEIKMSYPDEWVVVVDYEIEGRILTKGRVVKHGKNRDELDSPSESSPAHCAVIFTGEHKRGLLGLYAQDMESPS